MKFLYPHLIPSSYRCVVNECISLSRGPDKAHWDCCHVFGWRYAGHWGNFVSLGDIGFIYDEFVHA